MVKRARSEIQCAPVAPRYPAMESRGDRGTSFGGADGQAVGVLLLLDKEVVPESEQDRYKTLRKRAPDIDKGLKADKDDKQQHC